MSTIFREQLKRQMQICKSIGKRYAAGDKEIPIALAVELAEIAIVVSKNILAGLDRVLAIANGDTPSFRAFVWHKPRGDGKGMTTAGGFLTEWAARNFIDGRARDFPGVETEACVADQDGVVVWERWEKGEPIAAGSNSDDLLAALRGMQEAAKEIAIEFIEHKRATNWKIVNDAYVAAADAIAKAEGGNDGTAANPQDGTR